MSHSTAIDWARLRNDAIDARRNAYAPYSNFPVGAALLSAGGGVHCGVNVENASFGMTMCAERSAIQSAVSAGHQQFTALTVVADSETITAPCGACLQVLAEFVSADFPILLVNLRDGSELTTTLDQLLPLANQGLKGLKNNITNL